MKLLFALLVALGCSFARGDNHAVNPFGLATLYPMPAGILFPGLATAAAIDPAALGFAEKSTAVQLAFSPAPGIGNEGLFFASFATSKKGIGFGAGTYGFAREGHYLEGAFAGVGFDFEKVALGLTVRDGSLPSDFNPSVDFGILFGKGPGLRAGVVLYGLDAEKVLDFGLGYNGGKRYNLEANVVLPPFDSIGSAPVALSIGANLFVEFMNVLFRTTYYTGNDTFAHTIGLGFWVSKTVNLGVQLSTPRTWTFGLTLSL